MTREQLFSVDDNGSGQDQASLSALEPSRESDHDVIYHLIEASVADVVARMPDHPGYNTVRNTMAILERKGHLQHRRVGLRYLYGPVDPVHAVQISAVTHLLDTFFKGSLPGAVQAMLGTPDRRLSHWDLDEIAELIELARARVE